MGKQIDYTIRCARPGDTSSIVRLSRKSWPIWWLGNFKFGEEEIRRRVKEGRVLVAIMNGKVGGYLVTGVIWSLIHLEDLFVSRESRRLGVATALLKREIAIAKEKGFRKIISDADTDNKISYKFHLKNGFRKAGYIKHLWGDKDSFVFSKDL